jgi:hypothetical protein
VSIRGFFAGASLLGAACALTACGEGVKPANHHITGTVKSISRVTPGCTMPKILYLFFGCGDPSYRIELATGTGTMTEHVATTKVTEGDMRSILDQNVTLGCYRAPDERRVGCSRWATSVSWNGKELSH